MSGQDSNTAEADVSPTQLIEKLPELVNGNPALLLRGRYTDAAFLIEIGTTPYVVTVTEGRIAQMERGPLIMRSWSFAVRGEEDAWRTFWLPLPPPHFHDIFALAKRGAFRIEGDMRPLLTHLLYFKGVLEAPRLPARGTAQ